MSANASGNVNAGDLLSGLAANPDLLKNAIQMASALASSGMLNGLFGGAPSEEAPAPASAPSQQPPPQGNSAASSGIADLLAGLMGQSGNFATETPIGERNAPSVHPSVEKKTDNEMIAGQNQERKRPPTPNHNDRIHLLQSICPFLPEEKREKVQFLIKLLGLLSAAEQMGLGKLF